MPLSGNNALSPVYFGSFTGDTGDTAAAQGKVIVNLKLVCVYMQGRGHMCVSVHFCMTYVSIRLTLKPFCFPGGKCTE